jgi:acetoin utilization deacetylase AcuC-like enzyme
LKLIHLDTYVEGVLDCSKNNGFGNTSKEVADSLLWTNGSFVSAAFYAIENKENTVSPTSGFHHAEHRRGGGFCTFNGLALAAVLLKNKGLVNKVAIADIDMHYGNGTDNIIDKLSIDYISHYTFGEHMENFKNSPKFLGENYDEEDSVGQAYIKVLPNIISKLIEDADILFYQAGADPHIDDPYGGLLSTEDLKERDRIVFSLAKEKGIPVVWNLAGGYQEDISNILEIHNNTALMHQEIFV